MTSAVVLALIAYSRAQGFVNHHHCLASTHPQLQFEVRLSPQCMVTSSLGTAKLAQHTKHHLNPRILCAGMAPIATRCLSWSTPLGDSPLYRSSTRTSGSN